MSKKRMTNDELFAFIEQIFYVLMSFIGLSVLEPNFTVYTYQLGITVFGVIGTHVACVIYVLFFYKQSIDMLMQSITVSCVSIMCLYRLYRISKGHKHIKAQFFAAKHTQAINKTGERYAIINKNLNSILNITLLGAIAIFLLAVFYASYPMYMILYEGEKELLQNILIPKIDHTKPNGFKITLFVQVIWSFYTVAGSLGYFYMFLLITGFYKMFIELLNEDLKTMGDIYREKKFNARYRRAKFRNLCLQFSDITRFAESHCGFYASIIFWEVAVLYSAMSLAIYCIIHNQWITGVGVLGFFLCQFLILSYIGTHVQTSNKRLVEIIYDCSWYDFPNKEQQRVLFMLMLAQKCPELWIGKFAKLNYTTATDIIKSMYTLTMMLLRMVE